MFYVTFYDNAYTFLQYQETKENNYVNDLFRKQDTFDDSIDDTIDIFYINIK
jgi:hypothetical protein